jgi:hypothetical protein
MRNARLQIRLNQSAIKTKRAVEFDKMRVCLAGESPAPQIFGIGHLVCPRGAVTCHRYQFLDSSIAWNRTSRYRIFSSARPD